MNEITKRTIDEYKNYLIEEEKCSVTIEKYIRDITAFANWTEGTQIYRIEYVSNTNRASGEKSSEVLFCSIHFTIQLQ